MQRRDVLRLGLRGGLAFGAAKALHNTSLGYGHVGPGKNLRTQDLAAVAAADMRIPYVHRWEVDGYEVRRSGERLSYAVDGETWRDARARDVPPAVADLVADVDAIRRGSFSFSFAGPDAFFAAISESDPRAPTVELLRGRSHRTVDPETVDAFVGEDPRDGEALVSQLVDAFRVHTRYDVPRYLAGSVDDNLLPLEADLRDPFRPEESFAELLEANGPVGLFCGEYARLAIRAVECVPAVEQSPPLFGLYVRDRRHKHAYNAFGTVRRTAHGLELPMTFVDYTHTTLYEDLRLTRVLGDGFDAYDEWHRADEIRW